MVYIFGLAGRQFEVAKIYISKNGWSKGIDVAHRHACSYQDHPQKLK